MGCHFKVIHTVVVVALLVQQGYSKFTNAGCFLDLSRRVLIPDQIRFRQPSPNIAAGSCCEYPLPNTGGSAVISTIIEDMEDALFLHPYDFCRLILLYLRKKPSLVRSNLCQC